MWPLSSREGKFSLPQIKTTRKSGRARSPANCQVNVSTKASCEEKSGVPRAGRTFALLPKAQRRFKRAEGKGEPSGDLRLWFRLLGDVTEPVGHRSMSC